MCERFKSIFRRFRFWDNCWLGSSHCVFGGFDFDEVCKDRWGHIVYNFEYFICHVF